MFLIIFTSFIYTAYADSDDSIFIGKSNFEHLIFDGKWTFEKEWKPTTLHTIHYENGTTIHFRIAHDTESIYAYFDVVNDVEPVRMADRAVICIDSDNNQSQIPDSDDYCFVANLDSKNGSVHQGISTLPGKNYFKKIDLPENFIGIGNVSDENNRYSKIPHSSYEFKIPLELMTKNDVYGIYLQVYDYPEGNVYVWPQNPDTDISKPNTWGLLISPDKSIPEFGSITILITVIALGTMIFLTRMNFRF